MLPRSGTSFTLKQEPPDKSRSSKSLKISERPDLRMTLTYLPGENLYEESVKVRKRVHFQDGHTDISGTLYCTNFRIAFRPENGHTGPDPASEILFDHENDIALPSVERILAVSSQTKVKVLTAQSNLKFIPEELLIFYRGLRVLHLRFSDHGLQPLAYKITLAIMESQHRSAVEKPLGNMVIQSLDNRQDPASVDFLTQLFESVSDWENEIERLGASTWRVSPVNERCDTSTSLSKYFVVPSKVLDHDLKKTFAHFNQRRIPRWSWHHPAGSDLLRSAGFQTNTDPDKDDVRSIRSLLFANHSQCVIMDMSEELPSTAELQLSYIKLRGLCVNDPFTSAPDEKWLSSIESCRWLDHVRTCLKKACDVSLLLADSSLSVVLQEAEDRDMNCLMTSLVQVMSDPHARTLSGFQSLVQKEWVSAGHPFQQRINLYRDSNKEEAPVFPLFLDCVWQILHQFSAAFEFTESYLIALQDSLYNVFCSSFTHNCQWDRIRGNQRHSFTQTYTPINGWRNIVREKIFLNGDFKMEEKLSTQPSVWEWGLFYSPEHRQQFRNPMFRELAVLNGNGVAHNAEKLDSSSPCMFLLSRGFLIPQSPLFPWKSGTVSKKGNRRAQSLENLLEDERQLQMKSNTGVSHAPGDLLLPLCFGPWIRLWIRCYLRSNMENQVKPPPPGLSSLAEELKSLQQMLRNHQMKTKGNINGTIRASFR
uniref:Myotubularin related protein 11 n=1 Tax=Leptobrachium leishanense TaxID=445787 RepID=A0A8C5QZX2_9ANUR